MCLYRVNRSYKTPRKLNQPITAYKVVQVRPSGELKPVLVDADLLRSVLFPVGEWLEDPNEVRVYPWRAAWSYDLGFHSYKRKKDALQSLAWECPYRYRRAIWRIQVDGITATGIDEYDVFCYVSRKVKFVHQVAHRFATCSDVGFLGKETY